MYYLLLYEVVENYVKKRKPLRDAESAALREAERLHGGSRRDLAVALGMSERTLYRKLRALEG